MDAPKDDKTVGRRQHIVARALVVLMALLVVCAGVLLATGIGEGNLATNDVPDSSSVVKKNHPFYVLIIGTDSRKGTALYTGNPSEHAQIDQHADTLTLMRVDPKKHRVTLVSVPTRTVLRGQDIPLSDTLLEGDPMKTVDAVESLTGVDIPYYMLVNFKGFENVVDEFGSLTVDVDVSVKSQDPISAKNVTVKEGPARELLSSGALAYARAWDEYSSNNDAHRQANIRSIEIAIINAVLGKSETDAINLGQTLSGNVVTNMNSSLIRSLVKNFVHAGSDSVKIYQCYGPHKITDKQKGLISENKTAWKHLMYVVDGGYNPKISYKKIKQKEAQEAAEQAAQQQAQQYGYTDQYGNWHSGYELQYGNTQQSATSSTGTGAQGNGQDQASAPANTNAGQ
jgi:LCP family protein required for cell wall assembly